MSCIPSAISCCLVVGNGLGPSPDLFCRDTSSMADLVTMMNCDSDTV